ncbi:MAG: MutS family DNA mismatch repair protein [Clostridium sp.]
MRGLKFYENKLEEAITSKKQIENKLSLYGYIRGIIFIAFCIIGYLMYSKGVNITFILLELAILALFIAVVIMHQKVVDEKRRIETLLKINKMGINRINGDFNSFEESGMEFIDEKNEFTNDLDVYGEGSLFQMINTTVTEEGKNILADMLGLKINHSIEKIKELQHSIKELSNKIEWRQEFYIEGNNKNNAKSKFESFLKWCEEKKNFSKVGTIVSFMFIGITFVLIGLSIANIIPFSYILLILMINYIVIKALTKDVKEDLEILHNSKSYIKANERLLNLILKEDFNTPQLKELKSKLESSKQGMKSVSNILDWIGDSKGNAYYFIINVIFFTDIFIIKNVYAWRNKYGAESLEWFKIIGEIDALNSISNLDFDFEEWTYPEISSEMMVEGKEIRHPLIGNRAVGNNYTLSGTKKVTLITGSNMSGKSTFLRTIGINLLLAYIGAPTFSKEFKCGKMKLYTCMRTKDNLEESISSFYAEILRIKLLLEATKKGEKVFFLLDEIFKGTNSKDRHTGATVLIKQLIKEGAIGLVSTHDLELCDLEESIKEINNYNFREYYEENKIKFDYKMREGKSKTQNAIHLMKLAGIEFNNKE